MAGVNKVMLIGNLGRDPEVRYTQDGKPVANFTMATTDRWNDAATGEKKERTEWHRIVVWGNANSDGLAGIVEKYVSKGDKIYVRGQLRTRKWEDQAGNDRYMTEVVLSGFDAKLLLLGGSGGGQRSDDSGGGSSSGSSSGSAPPAGGGTDLDDEIPF